MISFAHFVQAIERIDAAACVLADRLERLLDGRPVVPIVRSSIETASDVLRETIERETPFVQPRDMIDEEWGQPAIRFLRARVATLELAARQRPSDLADWVRDLQLALTAFAEARARFDREIER